MNVAENANTAFGVEFGDLHGFVDNTFQIFSMMNHDFADFATGHCKCLIELVLSTLLSLFVIHLSSVDSTLGLFILFIPNLSFQPRM